MVRYVLEKKREYPWLKYSNYFFIKNRQERRGEERRGTDEDTSSAHLQDYSGRILEDKRAQAALCEAWGWLPTKDNSTLQMMTINDASSSLAISLLDSASYADYQPRMASKRHILFIIISTSWHNYRECNSVPFDHRFGSLAKLWTYNWSVCFPATHQFYICPITG